MWKKLQPEIQKFKKLEDKIGYGYVEINFSPEFIENATLFLDSVDLLETIMLSLLEEIKCYAPNNIKNNVGNKENQSVMGPK